MYFLHAINSGRQTRLLNVLGQIAMIMGDLKKSLGFVKFQDHAMPDIENFTVYGIR